MMLTAVMALGACPAEHMGTARQGRPVSIGVALKDFEQAVAAVIAVAIQNCKADTTAP
jgi:hypothetical protein